MSSLSMRVLELFDEKKLSFHETEKLLRAISSHSFTNVIIKNKRYDKKPTEIYIPPHFSSYMDGYTLEKQI